MLTVGRSARDLLLKKCTLAAWSKKKKVTERGFNVYLNERTNVALNKLFSESSVIAPHGTAAIKNGTTGVFQDPSSDSYWSTWGGQRQLPNNGAPHDTSRTLWGRWRWKGSPLRVNIRLGAASWESTCGLDSLRWVSTSDLVLRLPSPTKPQWSAQASYVKTTHERCGPFSLVVLSQRRGRVTTSSGPTLSETLSSKASAKHFKSPKD